MVGVAQLVRAPGCGPGGRGFETPRSPQFLVAQIIEKPCNSSSLCIRSMMNALRAFSSAGRATDS